MNTPQGRKILHRRMRVAWRQWIVIITKIAEMGAQKALPGERAVRWYRSKTTRKSFRRWRCKWQQVVGAQKALPRLPYGQLQREALAFWRDGERGPSVPPPPPFGTPAPLA